MRKFSIFSTQKLFSIDEILTYDLAIGNVFNKYGPLPDNIRHADAEAVQTLTFSSISLDFHDSSLVNESLYASSACLYLLRELSNEQIGHMWPIYQVIPHTFHMSQRPCSELRPAKPPVVAHTCCPWKFLDQTCAPLSPNHHHRSNM